MIDYFALDRAKLEELSFPDRAAELKKRGTEVGLLSNSDKVIKIPKFNLFIVTNGDDKRISKHTEEIKHHEVHAALRLAEQSRARKTPIIASLKSI